MNANQAGFTACLLCGAVGSVALGPSTISGVGGEVGSGDLEHVGRGRRSRIEVALSLSKQIQALPACRDLPDEAVSSDEMT